jgi:EAL and modified HD-GYP domain-containing signal transduction protein
MPGVGLGRPEQRDDAAAGNSTVRDVFIARQPIYGRDLEFVGYELLFRDGDTPSANVFDGDEATFTVMLNALLEFGLTRLVSEGKAFVNLTRNSILCEFAQFFPPEQMVMEVLEDVTSDPELLGMVKRFSDEGYEIALDDFVYRRELEPLVELADIVKLDIQALTPEQLDWHVKALRGRVRLLAERVETREQFDRLRDMGFEHFQGWFLGKAKNSRFRHVPTNQSSVLRLLSALHDPDLTDDSLADLIKDDVTLSFRVLRAVEGGRPSPELGSVGEALRCVGRQQLLRWTTLMSIAGQDDLPAPPLERSLVRGRTLELFARERHPGLGERFFLVGQLSTLGDLLGASHQMLFSDMTLSPDVKGALLDGSGPAGRVLERVEEIERTGRGNASCTLDGVDVAHLYREACAWSKSRSWH